MDGYTIKQVSERLHMPKDTLRYYDKLGLVCPKRSENGYRYYTGQDLLDLQYAEVMKFSGFTLAEIKQTFAYMRMRDACHLPELLQTMERKRHDLIRKQRLFHEMIAFISEVETAVAQKKEPAGVAEIDALVKGMFDEIRGQGQ
jgi:DNA-binding transcriptional MerR regulator